LVLTLWTAEAHVTRATGSEVHDPLSPPPEPILSGSA
jgi:hypothetical protein